MGGGTRPVKEPGLGDGQDEKETVGIKGLEGGTIVVEEIDMVGGEENVTDGMEKFLKRSDFK